jgi:hypothetical protein
MGTVRYGHSLLSLERERDCLLVPPFTIGHGGLLTTHLSRVVLKMDFSLLLPCL